MADSKITALTALTAADPVNDMFPVVDVSDTTMAASGTTKKISVNNILGASGTATLASATITGDLTVDTNVLKVDTTNDRVGIGTASPGKRCEINQSANAITTIGSGEILRLIGDDGNTNSRITEVGFGTGPTGATFAPVIVGAVNTNITGYGTKDFYVATRTGTSDVAPLERLRVTSAGNVNITTGNVVMSISGKGIDFSANTPDGSGTVGSEILNDYEEGTFTPNIGGTATYQLQVGRYTKIGNRVFFNIRLIISIIGTGSTSVISGLPFVAGASSNTSSIFVGYYANLALNQIFVSGFTAAGASTITMNASASASISMTNAAAIIGTNTDFVISGSYEV